MPSLTRGRVSSLQCNHWSESRRTHNNILLSYLRLSQSGGPGPRIYIHQEQGSPVSKIEGILRPTVSRPVCLGVGTHLEPATNFSPSEV
jgi:hypothetical protein